jgi:hypothetical protein
VSGLFPKMIDGHERPKLGCGQRSEEDMVKTKSSSPNSDLPIV